MNTPRTPAAFINVIADEGTKAEAVGYLQKEWDEKCELIRYIDGFFVSGNSVPVDRPWINAASWQIAKELLGHGLALNHSLIEQEAAYRRKLAAYGNETRAVSPLRELLAARTTSTTKVTA